MIYISIIIDILSYILPFINEISNILTASNLKPFKGLYKRCVDRYLLPSNVIKIISKNKICTPQELRSKIIIDILGLLGIIINIAKNAIQFGYLTSILSGIVVVMISFVIPNLYLQRIIISIRLSVISSLGYFIVSSLIKQPQKNIVKCSKPISMSKLLVEIYLYHHQRE